MKDQRVSLSEDVIPNFNDICNDLAKITEGMSGREIEKMCSNVYVSVKIWFPIFKADSLRHLQFRKKKLLSTEQSSKQLRRSTRARATRKLESESISSNEP